MTQKHKTILILIIGTLGLGLCLLATLALFGSGLTLWLTTERGARRLPETASPTPRTFKRAQLPTPPTATSTATATPIPTNTPLPTATSATATTAPTETATPLPTNTPPPSDTPAPTAPPPTATPLPSNTPTPAPDYPFVVKERADFDTSHPNFDVYVAIVDQENKPLSGYRVIGVHSSGLQLESLPSASDWVANSGAMHYKAGNIKYEVPQSPTGLWVLQLVDADNRPVAPPVDFSFDAANPSWHFIIFERK